MPNFANCMTSKKKKQKTGSNTLVKWVWVSLVAAVLVLLAVFVIISTTMIPDAEDLENPKYEQASIVYASDGPELGRYYTDNRVWATFDELNPHIVNALIATEDERFYEHNGIDARSTLRAVVFLGSKGGASTITQQLAKQFFTKRSSSFVRRVWQKMKEWVIAAEFEKRYTKEEILAMYLNKFDFTNNSHGISAASKTYFSKDQSELSIDQAAILVGMLKNPSTYNPKKFPENALNRRNVVMGQMKRNGMISSDKYNELKENPIDNSGFRREHHAKGLAPYFRQELTKYLKDLIADGLLRKPDGSNYNIYQDGLKVYTTIDSRMQIHAETAAWDHMTKIQEKYFRVWKDQDPWTYNADKKQLSQRKASFNRLVTETERYKSIRTRYLNNVCQSIMDGIDNTRLRDIDISRMLKEEKSKGHLKKLRRQKTISASQEKVYKKIMSSEYWPRLKKAWVSFQKNVKFAFNRKREMRVFAYVDGGEKTIEMTPLDSIKYHRMHMQLGSMSIDPKTGQVKTWVGGINFKHFQYDHVNDGNRRQVGSTFKPFLYTSAISNLAISPCHQVRDEKQTIHAGDADFPSMKSWSPANSDNKYTGEILTLKDGLKKSKNTVSVWLMKQLGNVEIVRDLVSDMGIPKEKIPKYPSICLGTPDLSVIEMTGAYTTFANEGVFTKPIFVEEIRDKNDRLLFKAIPEQKKVLSDDVTYVMVDMLVNNVSQFSDQLSSQFGGKTGTTDDYRDGWFMGVTPNLIVGTWVGGEDQWIHFKRIGDGAGSVMARPFFFDFMKKVESDTSIDYDSGARFHKPEDLQIEINCSLYAELTKDKEDSDSEEPKKTGNLDEEFEEELH